MWSQTKTFFILLIDLENVILSEIVLCTICHSHNEAYFFEKWKEEVWIQCTSIFIPTEFETEQQIWRQKVDKNCAKKNKENWNVKM